MKKDEDRKKVVVGNVCTCTTKHGSKPDPSSTICPVCGGKQKTRSLNMAETQPLNIAEMARMAQEGVKPHEVSGEWRAGSQKGPDKTKKS